MNTLTFDCETTGLDWRKDKIRVIGFKINEDIPNYLVEGSNFELFKEKYLDPTYCKIGFNPNFDCHFLYPFCGNPGGIVYDVGVSYANTNPFEPHDLKYYSKKILGKNPKEFNDLLRIEGKKKKRDPKDIPLKELIPYCLDDVKNTYELYLTRPQTAWNEIIEPCVTKALFNIENVGISFNREKLNGLKTKWLQETQEIEREYGFNLNSPKQVVEYLQSIGVVGEKASSDRHSLSRIAAKDGRIGKILRYRELKKLLTTYIEVFLSQDEDRISGSYRQAGTRTGRLSSKNPNMQNFPSRTKEGKEFRSCLIAPQGYVMVVSDLSQIEPRVFTHLSGDKKLIKAFKEGFDFHTFVTQEIYEKDSVTKEERFIGKTIGLATFYGAGVQRLKDELDKFEVFLSLEEVSRVREKVRNTFPESFEYAQTLKPRNMTTVGGRFIPTEKADYRINLVNALVQGSSADIMKVILLNLDSYGFNVAATVHDEVVLYLKETEDKNIINELHTLIEDSFTLSVPIVANTCCVKNWSDKGM